MKRLAFSHLQEFQKALAKSDLPEALEMLEYCLRCQPNDLLYLLLMLKLLKKMGRQNSRLCSILREQINILALSGIPEELSDNLKAFLEA